MISLRFPEPGASWRRAVADAASDYLQIVVFFPSGQISELQRPSTVSGESEARESVKLNLVLWISQLDEVALYWFVACLDWVRKTFGEPQSLIFRQ